MHIKRLGDSRSYRQESREFVCDGIKLLEEALASQTEIRAVLTSTQIPFPLPVETSVYFAERSLIDSVSPLKNSQEAIFVCKKPDESAIGDMSGTHILLDGLQDPGNVGTIIRTANAFGIKSVILTDGCADIYNPKTIRGSMGAVFRQKVSHMSFSELEQNKENGMRLVCAIPGDNCRDISDVSLIDTVIAVGSEGGGLSQQIISLCEEKIRIPIAPQCESLNVAVAAGIIMWEAARRARDEGM